ncbi:DNA/RNA non-specific endonuclease [Streptomyces sp. NPDC008079]|uniref:DNA/RNA non-specific endonuclease n=1 Tax=Streptomyces sp. NPDC008079 TaxID=3364806 RepID=UPI0036EEF714
MNVKGGRPGFPSRSRRSGERRALGPVLTALLVPVAIPVLGAGPAAAATATAPRTAPAGITRTAPAAVSTEVPAPLPATGGISAGLTLKTVIYNNEVTALQQRETKLTAEKRTLARATASYNSRGAAYNSKDAACAARKAAHNSKMDAYNARVAAYNATPHDFVLPEQQSAYAAAEAQKEQLDAEGVALSQETVSIRGEQRQLDTEKAQLGAEKTRLAADMTQHNARTRTWRSDRNELEKEHRHLLLQMVTALQALLDAPPPQAATMAQGADATEPLDLTGQAIRAPGGDSASRADEVASLGRYAVVTHVPVRFQPVVVRLSPTALSNVSAADAARLAPSVTYDAVVPEADGHYAAVGIRHGDAAPDTDADRARSAFDNVLAHGGQATATVDGGPVVIDRTITVPADDRVNDPCGTGAGFTGSSIVYLPRHKQAGECVATGAYGQLDVQNYTGDRQIKLGFALPGLRTLPASNRARGHLIGFAMGGSNTDTRNFVPLYQEANQWMYTYAERPVVKAVKAGGHVYVEAYPEYGDPNSAVPTSISYHTQGDVEEECVIENNPTGAGSRCHNGS